MDVLNITAPIQGQVFTGASAAPAAVPRVPQQQIPAVEVKAPDTAEQARYDEVVKAAEAVKANYFIVSDTRFTIFKDIAGDYVTRFTSLKDGSVKYFPQKTLFEEAKIRAAELATVFDTKA